MIKRNIAFGICCIFVLTACGAQQEDSINMPQTPSSSAESQAGVDSSGHKAWYDELISDSSYSLEDALEEYPEKQSSFDGEIIFDELRTGETSEKFHTSVAAGESIKLTMICDSDSSWESTLIPIHEEFFGGSDSCLGMMSFETKPLDENLSEWNIDIRPQDDDMSYRIILEIKGDK